MQRCTDEWLRGLPVGFTGFKKMTRVDDPGVERDRLLSGCRSRLLVVSSACSMSVCHLLLISIVF